LSVEFKSLADVLLQPPGVRDVAISLLPNALSELGVGR